MGLLGIFSKEGREQRAREKNIARAVHKFIQSADRFRALESLRNDGSSPAIYGLLKRFGMMYDKTIEDEQEKEWVFDVLSEKGSAILPEIERYLAAADSISWPLRLLSKVANKDQELAMVERILERHEPGYERDPTKKIQLLNHIGPLKNERITNLVLPYLADMNEGVRYAAVEAALQQGKEDVAREPLIQHFLSDTEDSLRIRLQIAEGFVERGWSVSSARAEFDKKLPEQFAIERDGKLKKKTG